MIRVDETDPVGEIEPSFPYRDVTVRRGSGEFKKNYDIQSEIGRGKFGTVYRCKDKETGLSLAAKVVNTMKKEDRRSVEREVEIMRRLQHPRLIQLYDAIDTGKQIYVILELIEGGELFERVIDDDFVLTERSCAVFLRQICEGIEFIHAQKILHLDLKPENILCLTKEGNRIKIIDFGLAREYDPNKKLQVLFGTPEFVAPEVVNFDQIGFGTDMWSIGVICYVLLSGLSPFMGDTDIETMANVTVAKYDFDHEAFNDISDDAKDFIKCLLVKDKEKRMNAAQCRGHRWLARKMAATNSKGEAISGPEAGTKDSKDRSRASANFAALPNENSDAEELDVTKDNLRLFVERWREHPDSPYIIDAPVFRKLIPCDEIVSLRCHSPSPCESICSSISETTTSVSNTDSRGVYLNVPTLSLALERRASEGTSIEKSRDPASQIVLADEIIRLSEHLRSIAMTPQMGSSGGDDGKSRERDPSRRLSKSKAHHARSGKEQLQSDECEHNEIAQKLSSIARRRKLNGTTFHSSRSFDRRTEVSGNVFGSFRKNSGAEESFSSVRRDSQESSLGIEGSASESYSAVSSFDNDTLRFLKAERDEEMDLTPPWRRPRVKHSFGETSRDVPRISTLRDLHKNLNLDEPGCAKDLLLHLLGEWEEAPRSSEVGRKSVSVDWCGEESVARKTINSLAEYFQSKQQSLNTSSTTVPPAPPSIHR